jgi:uncharacterized protein YjbI with pentapeptide repeats
MQPHGRYPRSLSKPPISPYPPDPEDDPHADVHLADGLRDVALKGVDWANVKARGAHLSRVEINDGRLTGAELSEATLLDVSFAACRLDLVGLRMASLERVVFRDCQMPECDLSAATLKDVMFERCELTAATLSGIRIERVELRGCALEDAHGVEALRGVRMPWSDVVQQGHVFARALGISIVE